MKLIEEIHIEHRINVLRVKAAERYDIAPEKCHIGHLILQAMLESPEKINQTDFVTDKSETNLEVANRSTRLASAMTQHGLQVGDHVVIIGYNTLDLCIPYYASHFNGYSLCCIDPSITLQDLTALMKYIKPKIVFCPKMKSDHVTEALEKNTHNATTVVFFDEPNNDMTNFIENHQTNELKYRPPVFDQSKTICWLMLTSGTTGLPKVAVIPYDTLLNGLCSWWSKFNEKWNLTLAMATIQWMSSLIFFTSGPLMRYSRIQSSVPLTPQSLVALINKYKPNVTAWTPYLLGQFLTAAGNVCDLSSFKYIAIGGSGIEKPLFDQFTKKCGAYLYLVYGMTELLVPAFDFNKETPFGSTGKPYNKFQYKLVGDNNEEITEPHQQGELWIKGDEFFKGYLNNEEETKKIISEDGWIMTGDIFYRTEENYYYFVERKRLLIKYKGFWISPLQLEEVIHKHPGVEAVCVVGLLDKETSETPVAAIVKKRGAKLGANDIFSLVKAEMPPIKQLHGGLFFVDSLPETPSGKIHRTKVRDLAIGAKKILPPK